MKENTRLKIFVKVVETGSFSAAGRQLDLSASAISRQINAIEAELSVRLLQRTTHSVSLTEAGHIFYQRICPILEDLEDTCSTVADLQKGPAGTLRLNINVEFGSQFIVPLIHKFLAMYPDISLDLSITDAVVNLLEHEVDLAIRFGSLEDSTLVARKFPGTDKMVICASPDYLLHFGTPATPEELQAHNCLSYKVPQGQNWFFRRGDTIERIQVTGNLQTNSGFALKRIVGDGAGITMFPAFLIQKELSEGSLVAILEDYETHPGHPQERLFYAVYPDRRYLPRKVKVFLDFVIEELGFA